MGYKRTLRALSGAMLLITALLAAELRPAGAAPAFSEGAPYSANQLVVRLKADVTIEAINADYGTSTLAELTFLADTFLLGTSEDESAGQIAARMAGDPRFDYVEPNYLSGAPEARPRKVGVWGGYDEAPRFDQYAPELLELASAHAITRGDGVTVAVIDTGVQLDHPALEGSLLSRGYDFIDDDTVPEDVPDQVDDDEDGVADEALGHGSHVAGIVLLVAPEATILPIRALNADGIGETYTLALAIEYAVSHGADVINLSLGSDLYSDLLADVIQHATLSGVLVVAAAGNDGTGQPQYPAADKCAIGVTSVDPDRRLAPLSTLAPWVDLAAPGEEIYSAMIPDGYGWWSGTSMATAFVSGQAALLLSERPYDSLRQITAAAALSTCTIQGLSADDAPNRLINVGASIEYAHTASFIQARRSFIPRECVVADP